MSFCRSARVTLLCRYASHSSGKYQPITPRPSAFACSESTIEYARPSRRLGSSVSYLHPSPMNRLMPSWMLLPNMSEHCCQTAVAKNGRSSTTMLLPIVRASLWSSIGPVLNVTVAVCARFHSSTACRYAVYVLENSRPVIVLVWSIRLPELGGVQMVGASRPNAVCSRVGTFVCHVTCALEEVRA